MAYFVRREQEKRDQVSIPCKQTCRASDRKKKLLLLLVIRTDCLSSQTFRPSISCLFLLDSCFFFSSASSSWIHPPSLCLLLTRTVISKSLYHVQSFCPAIYLNKLLVSSTHSANSPFAWQGFAGRQTRKRSLKFQSFLIHLTTFAAEIQ